MAKSTKKRAKRAISTKKTKKNAESRMRLAEYVNSLLELHKLQGVLLTQLKKQIS